MLWISIGLGWVLGRYIKNRNPTPVIIDRLNSAFNQERTLRERISVYRKVSKLVFGSTCLAMALSLGLVYVFLHEIASSGLGLEPLGVAVPKNLLLLLMGLTIGLAWLRLIVEMAIMRLQSKLGEAIANRPTLIKKILLQMGDPMREAPFGALDVRSESKRETLERQISKELDHLQDEQLNLGVAIQEATIFKKMITSIMKFAWCGVCIKEAGQTELRSFARFWKTVELGPASRDSSFAFEEEFCEEDCLSRFLKECETLESGFKN